MPFLALASVPISKCWKRLLTTIFLVMYSGDDDATDSQCQIQSVPNIFEGNILDHVSLIVSPKSNFSDIFDSWGHTKESPSELFSVHDPKGVCLDLFPTEQPSSS